ncbi:hypothetical protein SAMN04488117_11773 [Celeribacter baekdonensis]|uniref:PIN domain-containing protein n=1 Tax=Celeribacter baekdonensis TaxID=875171 RepID=A0A1G7THY0_9RHOB|nr:MULTISPECIES: hypothetical protein [Roseobacteraceae]MCZ4258917.1 hypothetical protein [Sulfitobacter sp. G21635-S1]SDG34933.1 hypothetical protein SAMN04488117_11773 [Celeribacter baekdonensis]|tara:strand:+ start:420 stop:3974 length:3555 start_codon:yes stop_codon:yes gene_type:complete
MKFSLPSPLKRLFQADKSTNTQSVDVSGDGNTVDQSIQNYIIADKDSPLAREILVHVQKGGSETEIQSFADDTFDDDDRPEIQRILEYRNIARQGDNDTAVKLLENLKSEDPYTDGYFAFRLNFNIGVIQQDIGDFPRASVSLRAAHGFFPDHPKAVTALAFAELLDGEDRSALERATELLAIDGDHRTLAACILCHAARNLNEEVQPEDIIAEEMASEDVKAAFLEYCRGVRPESYKAELDSAFAVAPENDTIGTMWALSVLDNVKQNQAFLLGAKMPEGFEDEVERCAEILRRDLENSLEKRPPNKLLLPSQANNAAVSLRLVGKTADAARLLDRALETFPSLSSDVAQVRAVLFLQEDKDHDALELIRPHADAFDLQIMASEIEAKNGAVADALERIDAVLKAGLEEGLRTHALTTKARIGINSLNREIADQALDELAAVSPESTELMLLKSAYERAFEIQTNPKDFESLPIEVHEHSQEQANLLASLSEADGWDFFTVLQTADELLARGFFRECTDLLRDRVGFRKLSPALETLCDACLRGHLGTLAKEIDETLSPQVKESVFGWRFSSNVAYLSGVAAKAVPPARKLFEDNPKSLNALDWYVQALLRTNDKNRIKRVVTSLDDAKLTGTVEDRSNYVKLLVFCGELERARAFAYRLFCENQNDAQAWLALSASVLAFGRPQDADDSFQVDVVQDGASFEIVRSDGSIQSFTLETDDDLFTLREGNIALDHPVAIAALGKSVGEEFDWPFKGNGTARITSVKHKALAAFHQITHKFEERFPNVSGFKSVSVNFEDPSGLDEMKAMLKQRVDYAQSKAAEYLEGSYPIYILGYHLGVDPIDALLGLYSECGIPPKVSSCSHVDQEKAQRSLLSAKKSGVIFDAAAFYLMRRLEIETAVEEEFGQIGVTQETVDVYIRRLRQLEDTSFFDSEFGERRTGNISIRDGQIIMTETSEEDVVAKLDMIRADLRWLQSRCAVLPAVAKIDPPDEVIRFRREAGGRFFDDIFAADGSGRVLISDDFHLRNWAEGLFGVPGAWMQALLVHLEEQKRIPVEKVVRGTLELQYLGEDALSTNADRLLFAAEMMASGEITEDDFAKYSSLLGQKGAEIRSHVEVALATIRGLWTVGSLSAVRAKATGIILRNLTRLQGADARVVLDTIQTLNRNPSVGQYLQQWRVGHFLP